MQIRTYRRMLTLILIAVTVILIMAISINLPKMTTVQKDSRNAAQYQYLLKEYDGKVGVYRLNETKPFRTANVNPLTLPQKDHQDLKKGIYVKNDDSLRKILEDFES